MFTGKNGFDLNFVMLWRRRKRCGLERIVFRLVLDPAQRLGGRHVAGRLVDAAEQYRDVVELDARSLLDRRQRKFGEIGIGAAEIEVELDFERSCHGTPFPFAGRRLFPAG